MTEEKAAKLAGMQEEKDEAEGESGEYDPKNLKRGVKREERGPLNRSVVSHKGGAIPVFRPFLSCSCIGRAPVDLFLSF